MQAIGDIDEQKKKRSTTDFGQQVAPTSTASRASFGEGTIRHSDQWQGQSKDEALRRGFIDGHFWIPQCRRWRPS